MMSGKSTELTRDVICLGFYKVGPNFGGMNLDAFWFHLFPLSFHFFFVTSF